MNPSSERFQAIEEIFHAALERPPAEVAAFLDERCGGDESLRRQVDALLVSHRTSRDFIETPIVPLIDASGFEEDEDTLDPLIGQTVGHYQISQRIGRGGMGAVYLARRADREYEKLVAIKLIKRGMDTEAVLRHFRNERQILAGFDHPNIARLLDGDTTDNGLPYFVMEYVEGLPIDQYCELKQLCVTERLHLFRQVCAAVSYAHRRAVIHRDIKPSNILVSADGVPKLLDFGIARILEPGEGTQPAATVMGLQVMTPEYASPEQLRGAAVTTVSDVYSLGVVLHRLLTGRLPSRVPRRALERKATSNDETEVQRPSAVIAVADAPDARARDHASRRPGGSEEILRRRLRGDLDNIVLTALRAEPERRYQSVEQFSDDIRRHLEMQPVLARADTLGYRAAKFVRRNAAATAAAALVVLSLLGGIVATSWQAHRAREQTALAKAEKARAERRFNEVRQLAHSVLFDYHDAIKDLPGATAVRERLVQDGLAYLDSLAGEANGDRALQRELAAAYERVGDVRGEAYGANLGDLPGALQSYMKALRIRETLAAADPEDIASRHDLARSYTRIGNRLLGTPGGVRGTQYLRKGVAVYRDLVAERPADVQIRQDLATAHNDLGLALEDWGDAAGALENHREALALRKALLATNPRDQKHRRYLAVTYINIGRALVLGGDTQGGLENNHTALAMCEALVAENPGNADYRRLLANTYQNDGDYRAVVNDTAGALASFRKKLLLDEQALIDDPVDAQSRGGVAYTSERLGFLLTLSGDQARALPYYRRALALYEPLADSAAEDLYLSYRVIVTHAGLAEALAKLGERAEALAETRRALALLAKVPEDPTNSLQSSLRGQVYLHVAASHAALASARTAAPNEQREDWRAARDLYAQSLGIWQDLQKRGILTGEDVTKPAEVTREIARCNTSLRKLGS